VAGDPRSSEAAERYASALFDLARDAKSIDAVARDAETLNALLAQSDDLRRLAESPAFSAEEKQSGLIAVAERAKLDPLLRRFLGVLASNRRTRELGAMLAAFAALVAEHRGVATAEVASARPLSPAQHKALAAALKSVVGREVEMKIQVKPEILGGLVVQVGSRMFDSSLRTKLDGLRAAMKGA
jgi:F-type H+-transporting ATPase subunit delta